MSHSATLSRLRTPKTAGSQPRHRHRKTRRTLLRTVLVAVVLVALVGGLGWLVGFSTVLAAKHVAVSGVSALDADEVRRVAQVPTAVPLARLDVKAVARRVATLKPVKSVTVTRAWPDTVKITVTERAAVFAVRQPDGRLIFDARGLGFRTAATAPKGVLGADVNLTDVAALTTVGSVVDALPPALKARVALVQAPSANAVSLRLKSGDLVIWGGAGDSELKAKVTLALLRRRAHVYDVSAPLSPTTR